MPIEVQYTAPDYFGAFGSVGEIHSMWLVPTAQDVMKAMWYASQSVEQFEGFEQTVFDLLMAGF